MDDLCLNDMSFQNEYKVVFLGVQDNWYHALIEDTDSAKYPSFTYGAKQY